MPRSRPRYLASPYTITTALIAANVLVFAAMVGGWPTRIFPNSKPTPTAWVPHPYAAFGGRVGNGISTSY